MSDLNFAIPAEWSWKALREISTVVSGGTPSRNNPTFWNGDIPWVTPTDITGTSGFHLNSSAEYITAKGLNSSGANLLPKGSILMTSRATLGESKLAARAVATNQGFKSLVPFEGVDGLYLLYQMQFRKDEYARFGIGTTFLEVNKRDTERFQVPVPSSSTEQRHIAEVLSALDEEIEATESLILKEQARFSGIQNELLSCKRFANSEVDDLPLREIVPSVQYGISSSLESQGSVPVLRMNNLGGGEVDVSDLKYSPTDIPAELVLKDGDVLFNRTNSMEHVGRTSLWRSQLERATFASYLVRLTPDDKRITRPYLVYLLSWEPNQVQMRRYATPGVQQVNINPTNLRRCRVRIPNSLRTQEEVVEVLDASRQAISALRTELKKLRLQKQGLMRDLLTGGVRVLHGGRQ